VFLEHIPARSLSFVNNVDERLYRSTLLKPVRFLTGTFQKSQLTAHEGTHASSSSSGSLGSSSKKSKKKTRQKTAESPATTTFSPNLYGSQHFTIHPEDIDESGIALSVAQPLSLTSVHSSAQFPQQQQQPLQIQQFQCLNQIVGHPIVAQTDLNQQILLENEDLSTTETTKSSIKQPGAEFTCKFCGKRYASASSLYVHTRLHTGERPFRQAWGGIKLPFLLV